MGRNSVHRVREPWEKDEYPSNVRPVISPYREILNPYTAWREIFPPLTGFPNSPRPRFILFLSAAVVQPRQRRVKPPKTCTLPKRHVINPYFIYRTFILEIPNQRERERESSSMSTPRLSRAGITRLIPKHQ